uniref:Alpha-1,4 glucan phosphorylase n=1 Tax=Tanacetum cinerariifolium TaxID=118510 RepID=A0A6L2JHQ7_TANCI|nr:glycogen phosphorylase 1-like [Tanacetum cinerariifolium]
MRVLLDEEHLGWERSWNIVSKVFSFTTHTILPEALEKALVDLLENVLPRHIQSSKRKQDRIMHVFLGCLSLNKVLSRTNLRLAEQPESEGSAYSNRTPFRRRVDLWQNIKRRVLVENASTDVVEPNGGDCGLGCECNARLATSLGQQVMLDFELSAVHLTSLERDLQNGLIQSRSFQDDVYGLLFQE